MLGVPPGPEVERQRFVQRLFVAVCVQSVVRALVDTFPGDAPSKSAPASVTTSPTCVNVASPLSQFITPPSAKNKSENCLLLVPNAAPSFVVGSIPVVIVGEVRTQFDTATPSSIVGLAHVPPSSPPGLVPTTISALRPPLAVPTK